MTDENASDSESDICVVKNKFMVSMYLITMKMKNKILRKVTKILMTNGRTLQFKIKTHKK